MLIEQWLIAPDGRIKFNDFNNAREPMWDGGKQKYCGKRSRYGGVWRSPEEFRGGRQDESIDVYAYGNCIYTLMSLLLWCTSSVLNKFRALTTNSSL